MTSVVKPLYTKPRCFKASGFTLIEVLVAMTIISITLVTGGLTASHAIENSAELKRRLVADLVAQNRLELHSAHHDWLSLGRLTGEDTQAGINLAWREEITDTPNPAFRKVVIEVFSKEDPDYIIRKLTGFLIKEPEDI